MAASPNDPRTKRRAAAGDDVNKMAMAPQPIPGMPQDQKGGNSMNYPAFDSQGQMGQKMGSGGGMMPYGDMMADAAQQEALGNIGFVERSNVPQNIVPGRSQNAVFAYNSQPQPDPQQMSMMEPLYDMNSAVGKTMPNGLNNGQPPSYNVTALGPTGTSNVPGNIPVMDYQMPDSLGLQGGTSGMNTGRGGGRNKGKKLMASTSTNKQPLLIDRVFNEVVTTDGLVSGASNVATGSSISYDIAGSNSAKILVNCTTNDGGLVEDIYAISRGATKKALFYLSPASDYLRAEQALFIGSIDVTATVGEYTNITALPRTMAPVPQQGVTSGMTALTQGNPLKNQALYVPTGKALWVTIWGQSGQNPTNCPIVGAQGGFF